jgi:hypothetical protein
MTSWKWRGAGKNLMKSLHKSPTLGEPWFVVAPRQAMDLAEAGMATVLSTLFGASAVLRIHSAWSRRDSTRSRRIGSSSLSNLPFSAPHDIDGFTNRQEYFANTDPQDPRSALRVQSVARNALTGHFALQWDTVGAVRYRVDYSDTLTGGWTEMARPIALEMQPGAPGTPSTAAFTDDFTLAPPANGRRFYRIRIP